MTKKYFSDVRYFCKECGRECVWLGGEQSFLQGLVDKKTLGREGVPMTFAQPRRCAACRARKRERFSKQNE